LKNPIEQFFAVEERPDGVYVKVSRLERDSINIDTVIKVVLQSNVMNLDSASFLGVYQRGRGAFERIGPRFEYYDSDFDKYLQLSMTPLKAALKISSGIQSIGKKINEKMLLYYLNKNEIKYGIISEQVENVIKNGVFDTFVEIACATPPKNGENARIEMMVVISPDMRPKELSSGAVDYRNIQTFLSVTKGQLIAEKIPPGLGKPGISVTGDPIPSISGQDLNFSGGRNTEITKDGKQLISSVTGVVFEEAGLIHIVELLQVAGNVDFSVGNIKYSGDVLIKGDVQPGFVIEADGDIHIKGEVEASKIISRSGSVYIEKGIIGKGEAVITAKRGIHLAFAQDTKICTEGEIIIDKFLLHCNCTCETLNANGVGAFIVGGEIRTEKQIVIKQLGNENAIQTKIVLFDKNKAILEEKLKGLIELEAKLAVELEPVERQLRTKAALLKKAGDEISTRIKDEVKKWVDVYNTISQKIKYVQQKKEDLKKEILNSKNNTGFVQVLGTIYPGTDFDLYGSRLQISESVSNKKFQLGKNLTVEY
jgi:uncharacterized protein (DUF342 family)